MEAAATSLRFRNALVFLRHQLRSTYTYRSRQQCRTNVNSSDPPVRKAFNKDSISKFINQGLGDMKNINEPTKGLVNSLQARGFMGQFHGNIEEFTKLSDSEVLHIYAGADATASSLHLGHLMVLMPMIHCMLHGHRTTYLVGIATARIGDPSGRSTERDGMKDRTLGERTWTHGKDITEQLSIILKRAISHAKERGYDEAKLGRRHVASNLQWHRNVGIIDFMQIAGHRARIGEMMLRKSVSERMKSKEGLSFSEFSYQLIQAMDYWHLFSSLGVRLQIGGSDQWGNITAGCDLINRMTNEADWIDQQPTPSLIRNMVKPYGLTVPLLTTSTGEKLSKTSGGGNIWLSPAKTPPFSLYQYLLNRPDDMMESWLKFFTILPISEIDSIMQQQKENPSKRLAQRKLAYEVVSLIHSTVTAAKCVETTATFFGQGEDEEKVVRWVKKLEAGLERQDVLGVSEWAFWEPVCIDDVMDKPTLIKSGGLSMGPHLRQIKPAGNEMPLFTAEDVIEPNIALFKVGKNNLHVIRLETVFDMEQAKKERADPGAVINRKMPQKKTARQRKAERRVLKKQNVQIKKARLADEKKQRKSIEGERRLSNYNLGIPNPRFANLVTAARNKQKKFNSESESEQPALRITKYRGGSLT
ncbi:hypothetical protein ABW20_dc0102172 [Dactylellina cionopaga]|nr:hypothetical protein ABW20_dc0102172 [Dactylellina cionopaga]